MAYDLNIGVYLDPYYINGFFDAVYYFLDDDSIKFNKENSDYVSNIRSKIDMLKEELLSYYRGVKPEDYAGVFKANEVDILSKYGASKGICRMYIDKLLESKNKKEK